MFTLNCKGTTLTTDRPLVMGILNITPDSFYSGSRVMDTAELLKRAEQMFKDGASIIDIGGQSSRPGSVSTGAEEELARVIGPVSALASAFPGKVISIDTYYSKVAKEAVAAGAAMVNDISAGSIDSRMFETVASLQVPYVLMHMKGTPATMQQHPQYDDVTTEVYQFLAAKISELKEAGVHELIVDPGFGFGKSIAHNFELLKNLSAFRELGYPVLLGISRKSSIYKTLGVTADEALNGSTVLHTIGLMNGASILRVHDVKEAVEAVTLFEAYSDHLK